MFKEKNSEFLKFQKKANTWWSEDSDEDRLLHIVAKKRIEYIERMKERYFSGKNASDLSCLDFGCGGGIVSEGLAKINFNVTGVDVVPDLIDVAKEHCRYLKNEPSYFLADEEDYKQKEYDIILSLDVAEHVDDLKSYVQDMVKLNIKKDGLIIVNTINKTIKAFILTIFLAENLGYVGKGTHEWKKLVPIQYLKQLFGSFGYEAVDEIGLSFNPFRYRFSYTTDLSNQYFITFKKK
jgi:2-polyprenyl-6-hydroxyphenyl methylase/3-demethylubiquinone-9 3-methyltransferase